MMMIFLLYLFPPARAWNLFVFVMLLQLKTLLGIRVTLHDNIVVVTTTQLKEKENSCVVDYQMIYHFLYINVWAENGYGFVWRFCLRYISSLRNLHIPREKKNLATNCYSERCKVLRFASICYYYYYYTELFNGKRKHTRTVCISTHLKLLGTFNV